MEFDVYHKDLIEYIKAYFNYLASSSSAEVEDSSFSVDYAKLLKIKSRVGKEEANKIEQDINMFIDKNCNEFEKDYGSLKKAYLLELKTSIKGKRKKIKRQ